MPERCVDTCLDLFKLDSKDFFASSYSIIHGKARYNQNNRLLPVILKI